MTTQGLNREQLDKLVAIGTLRVFPKGTLLINEGDRSDQMYVVQSGKLRVFLADSDGKEITVDILGPNDYFGEMALDGGTRSASVMTVEASKLSVIQREDFRRFLSDNPDASYALILRLIQRARHLTRTVGNLALLDVYGRVARLLLDSAREEAGQLVVVDRMSQQEIAKRINCSREMVSRILTDLREGDYIAISGDRIVIRRQLPTRW